VPDPYRALENPDDERTKEFVEKLNAISKPYFEAAGDGNIRAKIKAK
jgi:prolyl oligopeptidase PreP (S9A serine peptidase family)